MSRFTVTIKDELNDKSMTMSVHSLDDLRIRGWLSGKSKLEALIDAFQAEIEIVEEVQT